MRRAKAEAEQQLQEIRASYDVLLQVVNGLMCRDGATALNVLRQLRQGISPNQVGQNSEEGKSMLPTNQPVIVTMKSRTGNTYDTQNQQPAHMLPPIAQWYDDDPEAYGELFLYLKSTTQEEGVEVLRRVRQGQDISDILFLANNGNIR
ncbi:hypothetical protein VFPPC_14791 [Pochonia chlamydosporia 170]|uniref:Uncharacterized protein n=1 Tax=Pochonia chlamydosporia 170 TaxID=1380566 RepID=A0A179F4X6_METCM|nr:hypothetical protein VFPPC_14791 [Pochonia chlamydosporia 170]OAQ60159.1 hypothetical protein VFPPC_14791 [Pochonia chlamydosporia 170]